MLQHLWKTAFVGIFLSVNTPAQGMEFTKENLGDFRYIPLNAIAVIGGYIHPKDGGNWALCGKSMKLHLDKTATKLWNSYNKENSEKGKERLKNGNINFILAFDENMRSVFLNAATNLGSKEASKVFYSSQGELSLKNKHPDNAILFYTRAIKWGSEFSLNQLSTLMLKNLLDTFCEKSDEKTLNSTFETFQYFVKNFTRLNKDIQVTLVEKLFNGLIQSVLIRPEQCLDMDFPDKIWKEIKTLHSSYDIFPSPVSQKMREGLVSIMSKDLKKQNKEKNIKPSFWFCADVSVTKITFAEESWDLFQKMCVNFKMEDEEGIFKNLGDLTKVNVKNRIIKAEAKEILEKLKKKRNEMN